MSNMSDIFAEVDEELEAEKVAKLWHANKIWIISGLVLFFFGLFGYVGWREYREKQDLTAAEKFMIAMEKQEQGQYDASNKSVQEIYSQFEGHGYAHLAALLEAKSLVALGKAEEAVASLVKLGNNDKALAPLRALAWLQAAYLTSHQPEKAEVHLANIPVESAFYAPALELKGLFALAKGDRVGAVNFFREALTRRPQATLRERLELMVQRLSPGEDSPAKAP